MGERGEGNMMARTSQRYVLPSLASGSEHWQACMCMGVDAFTRLQHRDRRLSVSTLLEPDRKDLVYAARKATGRLPDDVRRILACRGLDDLNWLWSS